jgi:hypothetical protein
MSEYLDNEKLYEDIGKFFSKDYLLINNLHLVQNDVNLVITHETSPEWRNAILSNKPSLLALR